MQVYVGLPPAGFRVQPRIPEATYYGIVHNAATFTRDMVIGLPTDPNMPRPPEGTMIEIVTPDGVVDRRPWRPFDRITLAAMTPGENRWIGVTLSVAGMSIAPVRFAEMKGDLAVNGFSVAARLAPVEQVILDRLNFYRKVTARLYAGFHIAAAGEETRALDTLLSGRRPEEEEPRDELELDERVRIKEKDLTIEIDVRVSRRRESEQEYEEASARAAAPSPARYEKFWRGSVQHLLAQSEQ
jgi:hypothetical protein